MPFDPPTPCTRPGCPHKAVDKSGLCMRHKYELTQRYESTRRHTRTRKLTYRFKNSKARKIFLMNNPYCAECSKDGHHIMANIVDHIIPHRGDYKLCFDPNNWQPLCKRHHDAKTAKETFKPKVYSYK